MSWKHEYRERERVHFAALFSLHSCRPWAKGSWYLQNNGGGGEEPQEQVEVQSQQNWAGGREKERQGKSYGVIRGTEEIVVFKNDSSKSGRGMVLVEMW